MAYASGEGPKPSYSLVFQLILNLGQEVFERPKRNTSVVVGVVLASRPIKRSTVQHKAVQCRAVQHRCWGQYCPWLLGWHLMFSASAHNLAVLLRTRAGNEGYGVRPIVKRLCTQLVQIEMAPGDAAAAAAAGSGSAIGQRRRHQLVDSLNVSVATGILLHHMLSSARQ